MIALAHQRRPQRGGLVRYVRPQSRRCSTPGAGRRRDDHIQLGTPDRSRTINAHLHLMKLKRSGLVTSERKGLRAHFKLAMRRGPMRAWSSPIRPEQRCSCRMRNHRPIPCPRSSPFARSAVDTLAGRRREWESIFTPSQHQVYHPTTPNVRPRSAGVIEDVGAVAPGSLERVRQDRHRGEAASLVHLLREGDGGVCASGRGAGDRVEGVAEDVAGQQTERFLHPFHRLTSVRVGSGNRLYGADDCDPTCVDGFVSPHCEHVREPPVQDRYKPSWQFAAQPPCNRGSKRRIGFATRRKFSRSITPSANCSAVSRK